MQPSKRARTDDGVDGGQHSMTTRVVDDADAPDNAADNISDSESKFLNAMSIIENATTKNDKTTTTGMRATSRSNAHN